MIGETVGSYRIAAPLGEGGMGVVYVAEHPLIKRRAAVKVLRPQYSADPAVVERFFNEARASTLIRHPGIIDIFDFGYHPSGAAFIIMEFLEGETLASRIRRAVPVETSLLVEIARQIAAALAAAHAVEIVHRDLKPDNVFLTLAPEWPGGVRCRLLDFGIAKLAPQSGKNRTNTNALLGTPAYMSPEQCRGAGHVDHRSDIYSLGCVIFEMACGRPPFIGEGTGDLIVAHMADPPPRPRSIVPKLSQELEGMILRLLAKKPEERYSSMNDVVRALDAIPSEHARGTPSSPESSSQSEKESGEHLGSTLLPTTLAGSAAEMMTVALPAAAKSERQQAVVRRLVIGGAAAASVLFAFAVLSRLIVSKPGLSHGDAAPAAAAMRTDERHSPGGVSPAQGGHAPSRPSMARVHFRLSSVPGGAEVFRLPSGERVGTTPWEESARPAAGEVEFLLKLRGYRSQRSRLPADSDGSVLMALEPLAAPASQSSPGPSARARSSKSGHPARSPPGSKRVAGPNLVNPSAGVALENRILNPFSR